MKYFCRECGREIPPDADFCYYCGALKSKAIAVDDSGRPAEQAPGTCPYCGTQNSEGSLVCSNCGRPLNGPAAVPLVRKKLTKTDYLALILAAIPGAADVFGLGHFVMRKWSRGIMYLLISAIFIYIRWGSTGLSSGLMMVIWLLSFFVYFRQFFEVVALIYMPGNRGGR